MLRVGHDFIEWGTIVRYWDPIVKLFRPDYVQFFIAGISICQIVRGRDVAVSWVTLAIATLYTAFGHVGGTPPAIYLGITAVFVAAVLLAATDRAPWLESRSFVALGAWSYSIYLLHLPLARFLALGAEIVGLKPIVGVVLAVPVCIAMAAVASRWIERPALAWGRNVRQSRLAVVQP
ncbi:hypothetical protein ASF32_23960 [Methylobacterium sp. Leaf91]|nr:hypothetical protein ASF32_23960 [Methylobacterium sp. Leaf91]